MDTPTIDREWVGMRKVVMLDLYFDLDEMTEAENTDARDSISPEAMQDAITRGVIAIEDLLLQQLKLCAVRGMSATDEMYNYRKSALSDPTAPNPVYSSRVRLRGNSLSCVWYSNVYRQEGRPPLSREIRKGVGIKYHMRSFSKASEDEMEYINATEEVYVKVRNAAIKLRKLRSALAEYERSVIDMFVSDD